MSYKNLPPGRQRRLAYATEIKRQRHNVMSIHNRILFGTLSVARGLEYVSRTPTNSDNYPYYNYEFLSDMPSVKIGLVSKALLNNSKVSSIKQDKEMNNELSFFCTICQEYICTDVIRSLACSHFYHIDCIDKWFTENKKCPQCRFELI